MEKMTTRPVKGFRDFIPADWKIQNYIFDTWRKVCVRYGYEEYNGPVLENTAIYAKSGQDVGSLGKELYRFQDKRGRDLALRPEMTPTVGRMIAEYGSSLPKPIRWFSIAQFFRAEKPQRGRGREFFQLNADIFGSTSLLADLEIIGLSIDIFLAFGANELMFEVKINNRKFTNYYFEQILGLNAADSKTALLRIIDAAPKRGEEWLATAIKEINADAEFLQNVQKYLDMSIADVKLYAADSEGAREVLELFGLLDKFGYSRYCKFSASLARGFDYYTGMVFEAFDKNPENNRAMFGGGRYDDLLDIFDKPRIPAVGFAPGDITFRLFLEEWALLEDVNRSPEDTYYIPVISDGLAGNIPALAKTLRDQGKTVEVGLEVESVSKALGYANKKGFNYVVLLGDEETKSSCYKLKNMKTGDELSVKI